MFVEGEFIQKHTIKSFSNVEIKMWFFFPLKLIILQFNMKLCRKIFWTICPEFLDECVSNQYIILKWRAHFELCITAGITGWSKLVHGMLFFHWKRVDGVVFLRTLAFVQINDDWINERSKRAESKNKNKSIAHIHTICALCNASWSWVFYHLLKIIYIFISAIFFTRAFFLSFSWSLIFVLISTDIFSFFAFFFFSLWVESFLL